MADSASLPPIFVERLQRQFDEADLRQILSKLQAPNTFGIRLNRHRSATPEDQAAMWQQLAMLGIDCCKLDWALLRDLPEQYYCDVAATVPMQFREQLLESALWPESVYLQNPSSMVPAWLLAPQPGEEVLDMCAAPGSKTLMLAEMMREQDSHSFIGRLAACELVKNRFFKLRGNLAKQGALECVETFNTNAEQVGRRQPEQYDRVLLDAPCSSEGRFRMDQPDSWKFWSEKKIGDMARKQKKLMYSAIQALKPGGRLVYSTCTFAPEENEMILQHTLKKFGDAVSIVPIALELDNMRPALHEWGNRRFDASVQLARRILPTDHMDGFFVAQLVKNISTAA